ncbi:hypothetical protein MTO96_037543 [Rhipicephalus appendiculatus]
MEGIPNEEKQNHPQPESPSPPTTPTPGGKLLHDADQPQDKDLPQPAPCDEDVAPSTARHKTSRLKELPRTSETSLPLGRGILKSSTCSQEKLYTSQRPETTSTVSHGSSLAAPTSPEAALRPHVTDSERSHEPADAPVALKLPSAERLAIRKSDIGAPKG